MTKQKPTPEEQARRQEIRKKHRDDLISKSTVPNVNPIVSMIFLDGGVKTTPELDGGVKTTPEGRHAHNLQLAEERKKVRADRRAKELKAMKEKAKEPKPK